jgi:hypothetical protein
LELGVVGIVGYPENSGELTSAWWRLQRGIEN